MCSHHCMPERMVQTGTGILPGVSPSGEVSSANHQGRWAFAAEEAGLCKWRGGGNGDGHGN